MTEIPHGADLADVMHGEVPSFKNKKVGLSPEDFALAFVLGAMMLLPILEIVLRKTISEGVSNAPAIVQHLRG